VVAQTFEKKEIAYREWIADHPDGFVLNTHTKLSPSYMVLHRATCRHVTQYFGAATDGGFTERKYRKVCSETVPPIKEWVRGQGGTLSTCSHCKPE
jgi:hypothetical protein